MKPLPLTLTLDGFDLEQIQRCSDFAIYRQKHPNQSDTFEVIRINKQKAGQIVRGGVTITLEEKEKYPRTEAWGEAGWTFQTIEMALNKFFELQKEKRLERDVDELGAALMQPGMDEQDAISTTPVKDS